MGCGASSGTGSHRDAVSAPAATGNGGAKVVAPKKAGSAPLAPVPPVDEGDVNAELLTLGACPGSIFDHYIIGRTLGAERACRRENLFLDDSGQPSSAAQQPHSDHRKQ